MCNKCRRFYKTKDLPINEHMCDKVKCGNCKDYVYMDHKCCMLQKDIKPHSEEYVYFDCETILDPKTNKHIVNYCIAQDFDGKENVFHKVGEFCEWVLTNQDTKDTHFLHIMVRGMTFILLRNG